MAEGLQSIIQQQHCYSHDTSNKCLHGWCFDNLFTGALMDAFSEKKIARQVGSLLKQGKLEDAANAVLKPKNGGAPQRCMACCSVHHTRPSGAPLASLCSTISVHLFALRNNIHSLHEKRAV